MFIVGRPSPARLQAITSRLESAAVTYERVGITQTHDEVAGFRRDDHVMALGAASWQRACEGLRSWVPQRGAGAEIYPPDAAVESGATVLVVLPLGPVRAVAPCRIVYVVDEPDRFGFGYGTLPRHPEQGEESFVVERNPSDGITFRVTAVARPEELVARLGGAVTRRIQLRVTARYLEALRAHVAG